ncbi:MAG: sugar transferase [Terriglobales bacterium]
MNLTTKSVSQGDLADLSAATKRSAGFYAVAGKRGLDRAVSGMALLLLSPLLLIVAVCTKALSRGPVLFCQERVGKKGLRFSIVKFRTMIPDASAMGPPITVGGDSRVTSVGAVLRKYKLDELPQLWNVFKGEMSLVGPRPELPAYVALYTASQMRVLSVRPGITDPASIAYRHEESALAQEHNPERYYREQLLPKKLALSLRYIDALSLRTDLSILYQTAVSLLRKPTAEAAGQAAKPKQN